MIIKPIKFEIPTIRQLVMRSYQLFDDYELRRQWVKQSHYLYQSKKYILLTGKYPKQ
jgi:hypothetical protein